ncbi:hypothetical protein CDQ84_18795 [Clostridium thermosuccinogenes]|uniref:Uncharacterized protein n=1 Tax=Clostridium thermosuccinogenes TaxID=84032 RepID=A0A2K2F6Z5_9CLOT|nr:hypothetical protein CDO33_13200 [Pseudoclostridium thermosuccinogenes]PNT91816.1 hypothetical protein CDQ85_18720 [Pseudoclostridium thermosuccinogenes]PNT94553.1 hypothetical protein CDQ84_18795 [Pseudoclostridium thermosuccinogenes]
MEFFHFMQGFLSSGTLGFHCTKNSDFSRIMLISPLLIIRPSHIKACHTFMIDRWFDVGQFLSGFMGQLYPGGYTAFLIGKDDLTLKFPPFTQKSRLFYWKIKQTASLLVYI